VAFGRVGSIPTGSTQSNKGEAMLENYPTQFLRCRTFGHEWEEFVPVGKKVPIAGFQFALLCVSCGTERYDTLNTLGALMFRQYVKPEGYYLGFPLSRSEARQEYKDRERRVVQRGTLRKKVKK
jgi:hypothetical protein